MEEKTEAIFLSETPYLGKKKILKVFCKEHGLLSLMAQKCTLTPFCTAELVYRKTNSEIYPLKDYTLLDPLPELKLSYEILSHAGKIVQDLLRTQMPYKKGPYALSYAHLKKLPLNPSAITASFKLRLLLHEGLLSLEELTDPTMQTLAFSKTFTPIVSLDQVPTGAIDTLFASRFS